MSEPVSAKEREQRFLVALDELQVQCMTHESPLAEIGRTRALVLAAYRAAERHSEEKREP